MYAMLDTIVCGDAVSELRKIPDGSVDMAYLDPPYNIGFAYDVYKDKRPPAEYLGWVNEWLGETYRVLRPGGTAFVMCAQVYMSFFDQMLVGKGFDVVNRIVWYFTFGQNQRHKFTPSWVPIFYCVKPGAKPTFNADAIKVQSKRQMMGDKRAAPGGKVPDDVWTDIPRLCGTFNERIKGFPCQLRESLLERAIKVSTNPGDLVLDAFAGSGTTLAVAKRLNRRFLGIELSQAYCDIIVERLAKQERAQAA